MGNLLQKVGLSADAEDCSIAPISPELSLISNIDIVTPIHDDPYIMGKIAAVNVTNDLFALNAVEVMNYSAFLGLPPDTPENIAAELLRGSRDLLKSLGADIHGGHTIQNPWVLVGGSANSICTTSDLIYKRGVQDGDRLILTKPLGIHPTMAADRVLKSEPEWLDGIDRNAILSSVDMATRIMTTSNQSVARLIHDGKFKRQVHAMTDITGFGFTAHLREMLLQSGKGARIERLPIIPLADRLDEIFCYGLIEGKSAEIAGPMLMAVDATAAKDFTSALDDRKIWWADVGSIVKSGEGVIFADAFSLQEVERY